MLLATTLQLRNVRSRGTPKSELASNDTGMLFLVLELCNCPSCFVCYPCKFLLINVIPLRNAPGFSTGGCLEIVWIRSAVFKGLVLQAFNSVGYISPRTRDGLV